MKELLQLLSALPAPNPNTSLIDAINQHAQILNQHAAVMSELQQKVASLYIIALVACIIAFISFALGLYLTHKIDRQAKRIRRLEKHLSEVTSTKAVG